MRVSVAAVLAIVAATYPGFTDAMAIGNFRNSFPVSGLRPANIETRSGIYGGGHGPVIFNGHLAGIQREDLESRSPRATHHMEGERVARSEYADLRARDLEARAGIYGGGHGPVMINGRPFGMKREDLEARSPRATHHLMGERLAREYDDVVARELEARYDSGAM